MANQGKYEPQEIPEWVEGDMQEAEDLALEMMQLWLAMTPEQQQRLIALARDVIEEQPK